MKRPDVLLIIIAFLALALAYSVVIPPFEGLDEVEHFGVARYVTDTGRLPVQGDASLRAYHVRQEASQPPLYYLLAGSLLRLTRAPTDDTPAYLVRNPFVTCGTETIRSNKATLRHDPYAEAFPWSGALLAVHGLRLFSILLQAFTLAGVYAIARRACPHQPGVPALAAALTAFNPQFLIVASSVNNDNVATPVVTWALYTVVLIAQDGASFRRALVLGLLIGLAALSKLTGLLLLPLAAVASVRLQITGSGLRSRLRFQNLRHLAITAGAALAMAGWWYVRNGQLYGDPSGLAPMLDIVGRREAISLPLLLAELKLVFRSYWGQFPCAFFDSQLYYSAWALVAALGLAGAVWGLCRNALYVSRFTFSVLAAWLALVLIGWLRWNLTTPAPGGRLLFTAMGATSTLLAYGLTRWLPHSATPQKQAHRSRSALFPYGAAAAAAGVGALALLAWVRPLFAPPPMADAAQVQPSHPLDARFGESIGLMGYDLHASDLGPGRFVDVTLYWRALQPVPADYVLALQLAAPAPGDTRTLLNFNTWPGGGNLPTAAWPVGPVILDRYRVPLPSDTGPTQAWRFQIVMYNAQADARLPLTLGSEPAGDALALATGRVAGAAAELPEEARLAAPATFAEALVLTHAQVDERADGVHVRLLWHSLAPLPRDATVFVHAYDEQGVLLATGDGPPMAGNFPTSLWQSGDRVLDEHVVVLPGASGLDGVRIMVGLYWPEDGTRLAATQGAARLPDDSVVIWPE